jgi:hypothetical protein
MGRAVKFDQFHSIWRLGLQYAAILRPGYLILQSLDDEDRHPLPSAPPIAKRGRAVGDRLHPRRRGVPAAAPDGRIIAGRKKGDTHGPRTRSVPGGGPSVERDWRSRKMGRRLPISTALPGRASLCNAAIGSLLRIS